jgi:hypothetical protein
MILTKVKLKHVKLTMLILNMTLHFKFIYNLEKTNYTTIQIV